MNLFTKYRPQCWDDVVGHARMKLRLIRMATAGDIGGRAFLFTGPSGVGKSSVAYILAREICDPDNVVEIDGSKVTTSGIDDIVSKRGQLLLGNKPGKVHVINECHKLDSRVIGRLLTCLEDIRSHEAWIFTTQGVRQKQIGLFDDADSGALESRCTVFELEGERYATLFAQRAMQIAVDEGLESGQELVAYVRLAAQCEFNLRKMLSRLDAGEFLPEQAVEILESQTLSFAGC
ncbi:AAA family ATPase [Fuerstiella marisgermanici]|uniref:DNA polymerase III subunit gamma/tau n=1 Tax=Fuerstiella marisgermanici TaxID=1891926 RepID=A0A1P8WRA9_9PLAN|nr:AAA family ATPase [Fuerstiella marisgermanici]APZ96579.1 DNA polymerase III subunit gamma/tau [Fuerstiella marisgermanici]